MPIQVSCGCGKHLRVPDEHAGKRVRCPICGEIQTVPEATMPTAALPAEATLAELLPPPPVNANPSLIHCTCAECGRAIKARLEQAGKKVKCPDCGGVVQIPGSAAEATEAADEDVGSPKKKKGKKAGTGSKTLFWVGIVSAVIVLLGGLGFAGYYFLAGGASGGEKELLPTDAVAITLVHVSEILKTPLGQEAYKSLLKSPELPMDKLEKIGIGLADIDHLGVVVKGAMNQSGWVYLTTTKPIDQAKTIAELDLQPEGKSYQGVKYYLPNAGKAGITYFASPKLLVLANDEPNIQEAIDRLAGRKKSSGTALASAIAQIDKHQVVVGLTIPPEFKVGPRTPAGPNTNRPGAPNRPGNPNRPGPPGMQGGQGMERSSPLGKLGEMLYGTITVDITDNKVVVDGTGLFPSEEIAKDAKTQLDGTMAGLTLFMPKEARTAFKTLKISQVGDEIKINASIDIPPEMLQQLLPKDGKPPTIPAKPVSRVGLEENLKHLARAYVKYTEKNNGQFPAVVSPQGKPFSWRVAILPYIEGGDAIYKQLHLNEAWDSPHNLQVAKTNRPPVFAPVGRKSQAGETYYKVFTGSHTLFGPPSDGIFRLSVVPIGTTNAILFVEAQKPVLWTKPEEILFEVDKVNVKEQLYWVEGKTTVTMADGGVRSFGESKNTPQQLANRLNPFLRGEFTKDYFGSD